MEKINENAIGQKEARKNILDDIPELKKVTTEDMEKLRREVLDEFRNEFNNMSEDDKIILVYIYKLEADGIKELLEIVASNSDKSRLSFKQINKSIQFLIRCTDDEKYDFLREEDEK